MVIRRLDISSLLPALDRQATLLAPNYRISDAILGGYAAQVSDPVFRTPQVAAVDIWIRELWDNWAHSGIAPFSQFQILSSTEEHFIWVSVIEQSLAQFPLLNPEATARGVSQSYRDLRQWLPDRSLHTLQQHANTPDTAAFLQWVTDYRQTCTQQQRIALVDAIGLLLELSDSDWQALPLLPQEIGLVNFFEPPPLYQLLFTRLHKTITVNPYQIPLMDTPASAPRVRMEFSDQEQEITACANWARQLRIQQPEAHIGIVYAQDFLAQPPLRQLFNNTLDAQVPLTEKLGDGNYNSSGSRQSLLDTGLINDAFLILNLIEPKQSSQDLCRLLQSPYIKRDESEQEALLKMELFMRRYFSATTSMADFSKQLQRTDRPYHAPLLAASLLAARSRARHIPTHNSLRDWAQHFSDLLTDLGWPGTSCTPADREVLQQWHSTLRVFAKAGQVLGQQNRRAALNRLRNLCAQQTLPARFRQDNPLSIYSVSEATGLQFDHVWLLGFNTQNWPPASQPSPFISYSLQRDARIPGCHSDVQYDIALKQFSILQASVSRQIIASHHDSDGELEFRPSSFISDWPVQAPPPTEATPAHTQVALETIVDPTTHPLSEQEIVHGGQRIISNQSSCPFRAFAMHRLQAQPLQGFESGLTKSDRGSAVHEALEVLFKSIDSLSTLQSLTDTEREALISSAAAHAIDFLSRRHSDLMTPRFRQLEKQRITALLQRFLALEIDRNDFNVIARELPLSWQHGNLQLNIKIDRVDELNDHTMALIDYKTGKRVTASKSWVEQRPEDMQLPLYYTVAAAQQKQAITALAIAHVNVETMTYSGLAASSNLHKSVKPISESRQIDQDWQALTTEWQTAVQTRAAEFVAGEAQVAPVNGRKTCQYCGLDALCRIQELDTAIADEDDEPESGLES